MPTKCCDACFARPAQGLEDVGTDFDKKKFTLPRADVCWCRSGEKPFAKHWCKKLFDLLANQDVDDFKDELERLRAERPAELRAHVNCFSLHGPPSGPYEPMTLLHLAFRYLRDDEAAKVVGLLLKAGADKEAQAVDRKDGDKLKGHKPNWAVYEWGNNALEAAKLLLDREGLKQLAGEAEREGWLDGLVDVERTTFLERLKRPADLLHTCTCTAEGDANSGTPLYVALHKDSRASLPLMRYLLEKTRDQRIAVQERELPDMRAANEDLWQAVQRVREKQAEHARRYTEFLKDLFTASPTLTLQKRKAALDAAGGSLARKSADGGAEPSCSGSSAAGGGGASSASLYNLETPEAASFLAMLSSETNLATHDFQEKTEEEYYQLSRDERRAYNARVKKWNTLAKRRSKAQKAQRAYDKLLATLTCYYYATHYTKPHIDSAFQSLPADHPLRVEPVSRTMPLEAEERKVLRNWSALWKKVRERQYHPKLPEEERQMQKHIRELEEAEAAEAEAEAEEEAEEAEEAEAIAASETEEEAFWARIAVIRMEDLQQADLRHIPDEPDPCSDIANFDFDNLPDL